MILVIKPVSSILFGFLTHSRYEFIEMLARIKVSKIAAFKDIRSPCKNKDLEGMYTLLMSNKGLALTSFLSSLNPLTIICASAKQKSPLW